MLVHISDEQAAATSSKKRRPSFLSSVYGPMHCMKSFRNIWKCLPMHRMARFHSGPEEGIHSASLAVYFEIPPLSPVSLLAAISLVMGHGHLKNKGEGERAAEFPLHSARKFLQLACERILK